MGLIKCSILTRAKDIEVEYISSSQRDFDHNKALYIIPNELCNLTINEGKVKKQPQLFYTEGNPYPVDTPKYKLDLNATLDSKIFENFVVQSSNNTTFDLLALFHRIGWKNFLIGLGVLGVAYWIISSVI